MGYNVNVSAECLTHTNSRGILRKYANLSVIPERRQIPSILHRGTLPVQMIPAMECHGTVDSFDSFSNSRSINVQEIRAR